MSKDSVVKEFLTTASDGKPYSVEHYLLNMILAVGYRIKGVRGTQFRQWATRNLSEYLVKGFIIDTDRLKNPDGRPEYFIKEQIGADPTMLYNSFTYEKFQNELTAEFVGKRTLKNMYW